MPSSLQAELLFHGLNEEIKNFTKQKLEQIAKALEVNLSSLFRDKSLVSKRSYAMDERIYEIVLELLEERRQLDKMINDLLEMMTGITFRLNREKVKK